MPPAWRIGRNSPKALHGMGAKRAVRLAVRLHTDGVDVHMDGRRVRHGSLCVGRPTAAVQ